MTRVPRAVVWLLSLRLSPEWHDVVIGDLHEGLASRQAHPLAARWWVWSQAIRVTFRPPGRGRSGARSLVHGFWGDLTYSGRLCVRRPLFGVAAVAVIAASSTMALTAFAVVDGVLFRPLPYPRPGELHFISGAFRGLPDLLLRPASAADVRAWQAAVPAARLTATSIGGSVAVSDNEGVRTAEVDRAFADVVGVTPVAGGFSDRDFTDPGAIRPALITDRFWRQRFGGDPRAIGRRLTNTAGQGLVVAGILPADFVFPHPAAVIAPEVLLPLRDFTSSQLDDPGRRWLHVIARVPAGISSRQIEAWLAPSLTAVAARYPPPVPDARDSAVRRITRGPFDDVRVQSLDDALSQGGRDLARLAFATAAALLLLGCINVAGLSASRLLDRRHELATRRALGASSAHIARLIAAEHGLLVATGMAAAILASRWLLDVALLLIPSHLTLLKAPAIDLRAAVFAGAAAVGATAVSTALSLRRGFERDGRLVARGPVKLRTSARSIFLTCQVAGALLMLLGGLLFVESLRRVWREDPGFNPDRTARLRVHTPRGFGQASVAELLGSLKTVPGVTAIAALNEPFLERAITGSGFTAPTGALATGDVEELTVSSGYFEAAGLRLLEGRYPAPAEFDGGAAVIVVSRSVARSYWPRANAIGRTLEQSGQHYTVTGVVADARYRALDSQSEGEIYSPLDRASGVHNIIVRFDDDEPWRLVDVRRRLEVSFPSVRVSRTEWVVDALAESIRLRRWQAWIFGGASVTALVVAVSGVVGLVGMAAARRTREIGLRIALGATRGDVTLQFVREQASPIAIGVALGSLMAWAAAPHLRDLLYDLSPFEPGIWGAAVAVIALTSLLGTLVPVARAVRVDPATALRPDS